MSVSNALTPMDQERERIQEDLRGLVDGDVRCDDLFLQLYATDGSIHEIKPLGVVRPRTAGDVAATLQYAAENRVPVHARGAGSGLAGESLGRGLILDFSRYMRRIVRTDAASVRVQPGVVHGQLNAHLKTVGRLFGPDPAMSQVTTMGSVIAIDASGSHWLQYGSARKHIISLQVVLADGQVMEVGRESLDAVGQEPQDSRRRDIVTRLADLLRRHQPLIAQKQPKSTVNRSGYQLNGVLQGDVLDVPQLLAGSEGTLALITEATLATLPLPRAKGVAILMFESLEKACLAVQEILPLSPVACDLLDRRHLSLARESEVRYDLLIPAEAEAVLIVETVGDDVTQARQRLTQIVDRVRRKKRLAFDARQALERDEMALYWQLARRVGATLQRLKGSARPLPFVEDVAVPPAALPDFMIRLQNTLKRYQVTASLFGHVGHGQLHVRPFLDLTNHDDVRKIQGLATDLYHEVLEVGGTISGEHGDGLSRTPFIRQQYGALYDVFREVKHIFDPQNILNPGKIIADDPHLLTRYLRSPTTPEANGQAEPGGNGVAALPIIQPQLALAPGQIARESALCNGCGACRTQSIDFRMCPVFRGVPSEEASPRAKANLMRGLMSGSLDSSVTTSEQFKAIADLCVNCHQCRLECPANVDIPALMIEAKATYVATNGLKPTDWLMSRVDSLSYVGSRLSAPANWALRNRQMRWLMEKLLGIAQGRKIPKFAARSFMRRATRRRLTRPTRRSGRKVLYFVDTYANYHDPQLAEALVAVMEHNGIAVYVHPAQRASGMAMISQGALVPARKLAARNLRFLAEAVRQGYEIVASEPSTALCLTREYLNLFNDDDALLVAQNTSEACAYLWKIHRAGKLQLDLKPVNATVAYHMPCHVRALGGGSPGENLMRLIPGLSVQRIEKGCSGMAGTYGLKRENYRASLRAGFGLISSMRDPSLQVGTTECSACKIQMEQGTTKPTIHPLKLLALAYGMMPEVAPLLTAKGEELVAT